MNDPNWERSVLERVALAAVTEQRRARRWQIFFRFVWLSLIAVLVFSSLFGTKPEHLASSINGHTALIRLEGAISSENQTADYLIEGLDSAYQDSNTKGIIIQANSPGGSPVLSGRVFDEIRRQRQKHPEIPVHVVVEEVCASGCYYIASAADKIFVDKASIIGSIGVLSDGFGFTEAMAKLGVERRLQTAGNNKALGDPFSPSKESDQQWRQQLLNGIHNQFIQAVKQGRGQRLRNDPDLFSGLVWLGEQSIPLGLADGYGSVQSVAREVIKAEEVVGFSPRGDLADRFAKRFGVEFSSGVHSYLNQLFSPQLR